MIVKAGVLTISDKGSRGERKDESGAAVAKIIEEHGYSVVKRGIVPDDKARISETLVKWADSHGLTLILTSGGTGLSPTDVTPQATSEVIEFEVPGIAEAMRSASLKKTPHAMISRAVAGVRNYCLIINLPGSKKGAVENLESVMPALDHALSKLLGDTSDCAT
ncbi:molybdenum cofactor biosynthesis protein B [Thermodesulfobacteriota bacterium]